MKTYTLYFKPSQLSLLYKILENSESTGYTAIEIDFVKSLIKPTMIVDKAICRKFLHCIDKASENPMFDQGEVSKLFLHVDEANYYLDRNLEA